MPTFECPTCDKTHTVAKREDAPHRPFCCKRCKMIDLGKWLDGSYVVSEPIDPETLENLDEQADTP